MNQISVPDVDVPVDEPPDDSDEEQTRHHPVRIRRPPVRYTYPMLGHPELHRVDPRVNPVFIHE